MPPSVFPERTDFRLNRLLAYQAPNMSLIYDMSTPPSSLRLPIDRLSEAATWPVSTSMQIACAGLPWPIEITAVRGGALTCLTVLCGIFASLHRPVSELEWTVLSPAMQRVAWDAFLGRLQANPTQTEEQPRRLDLLSGKTLFRGLSSDVFGKWVLHMDSK